MPRVTKRTARSLVTEVFKRRSPAQATNQVSVDYIVKELDEVQNNLKLVQQRLASLTIRVMVLKDEDDIPF